MTGYQWGYIDTVGVLTLLGAVSWVLCRVIVYFGRGK